MEDSTAVSDSTVFDYSLIIPEPIAIDWEAKYNEAVAQHNLTLASYSTLVLNGEKAMTLIGDRFFDEAEKREWCKDAYDFVESINDSLPYGFSIPLRLQKFLVMVTITGEISEHHEVSVTARTQEDADTEVSNDPDAHFDPDEVLRHMNLRWATIENIEVTVD